MPGESLSKSVLRQKEPGPSKYNLRVHCKGAWTGEEDTKEIVFFFFHHFSLADFFRACHRVEAWVPFLGLFLAKIFFFNLGFSALNCWFWGPGACDSWDLENDISLLLSGNPEFEGPKKPPGPQITNSPIYHYIVEFFLERYDLVECLLTGISMKLHLSVMTRLTGRNYWDVSCAAIPPKNLILSWPSIF